MITANLFTLPLQENWTKANPAQRCRATFPLFRAVGTEHTAMVYFELDRGDELGRHTDSAEEVLIILDGAVEVTVGESQAILTRGQIAVVPTMIPHNLRNVGGEIARVAGVFPDARLVATFDEVWEPAGSRVVDTDQIPVPA
jgi:quercetin dioxygenase-like cupin family protein